MCVQSKKKRQSREHWKNKITVFYTFHHWYCFQKFRFKISVSSLATVHFLTQSPAKGRGNRPKPIRFWFEWHIDRNRIFHCVTPNSKKGLLNKRHIVFCCGRWVAGDNKRGPKRRPPEQTGYVLNFSVPHPFENTLFLGVQHRPKRHLGIKSGSFQVLEGGLGGLTSTSVYPRICHTLRCSDCCFFAAAV